MISCFVDFRDKEHFYKVINWLLDNAGIVKKDWTIEGRVLKRLKRRGPTRALVKIFNKQFDESSLLFLQLL